MKVGRVLDGGVVEGERVQKVVAAITVIILRLSPSPDRHLLLPSLLPHLPFRLEGLQEKEKRNRPRMMLMVIIIIILIVVIEVIGGGRRGRSPRIGRGGPQQSGEEEEDNNRAGE